MLPFPLGAGGDRSRTLCESLRLRSWWRWGWPPEGLLCVSGVVYVVRVMDSENRLVVLGASNVVRGLPDLVRATRLAWDRPMDVMAALGHGRSYGLESGFLGRQLPGILDCDLWAALEPAAEAKTLALVSDVGNDLLYGVAPEQLARWVEECVERLQVHCATVLLMRPPLARLASLSRVGFETARRLFFPARALSYEEALQSAFELDHRLSEVADRRGVPTMAPPRDWYGLDPIHITRRARAGAWLDILGAIPGGEQPATVRPSIRGSIPGRLALRFARQSRVRFLGFDFGVEQPARRFSDGSGLFLF